MRGEHRNPFAAPSNREALSESSEDVGVVELAVLWPVFFFAGGLPGFLVGFVAFASNMVFGMMPLPRRAKPLLIATVPTLLLLGAMLLAVPSIGPDANSSF